MGEWNFERFKRFASDHQNKRIFPTAVLIIAEHGAMHTVQSSVTYDIELILSMNQQAGYYQCVTKWEDSHNCYPLTLSRNFGLDAI